MLSKTSLFIGAATILMAIPSANATIISPIGTHNISAQSTAASPVLVAQKFSARKGKKRVARTLKGRMAISPTSAQGDGYPTPGRAFEACGGAGNVFVMYDIEEDGTHTNHSFHCVD